MIKGNTVHCHFNAKKIHHMANRYTIPKYKEFVANPYFHGKISKDQAKELLASGSSILILEETRRYYLL